MRVRWRKSWGDLFDFLVKDRDLLLLLIIAVLGALIGIAALFGVLTPCAEAARQLLKITPPKMGYPFDIPPYVVWHKCNSVEPFHCRQSLPPALRKDISLLSAD
jgi:hypothetical protein